MRQALGTDRRPVDVVVEGDVPDEVKEEARQKIAALAAFTRQPILYSRVRMNRSPNPAVERPVVAQGNVHLNGRLIRAQVAACTPHEAVMMLEARLRRRLVKLARHPNGMGRGRQRGIDEASSAVIQSEWSGGGPGHRPRFRLRSLQEREVVRRKSCAPARTSIDEAAFDMDLMDYDFHLFVEAETGQDSVIYRADPPGYRLAQVKPDPSHSWETLAPLTVCTDPAPVLSREQAKDMLDTAGLMFVFFVETRGGRGRVMYRRYDGHYGLIVPIA